MPSSSFFTVEQQESAHSTAAAAADETTLNEVPIEGAPVPLGGLHQLNVRGRTFRSTLHPLLSQGRAWITEKLVNARSQSSFIVTPPPTSPPLPSIIGSATNLASGSKHFPSSRRTRSLLVRHPSSKAHSSQTQGIISGHTEQLTR